MTFSVCCGWGVCALAFCALAFGQYLPFRPGRRKGVAGEVVVTCSVAFRLASHDGKSGLVS
ncbi:hypothetical protein [Neorhodopirellula lusitana]|uniref:hypothetical protein n=1 Tax=Neorhodopirellula lusitana TaxID=445327 RepID=UPI0024B7B187|nr:hypothetical protein [Neorhodopirellula lusitana]